MIKGCKRVSERLLGQQINADGSLTVWRVEVIPGRQARLPKETAASAAAADCPVGEASPLRLGCDLKRS